MTQSASSRDRFFLTVPVLSRLAAEANTMASSPTAARKYHHDLSIAVWTRQEENILKLKNVIASSMNPMTGECEDLTNIITNVVMPNQVQKDVCNQDETGQLKYITFVKERINDNEVNSRPFHLRNCPTRRQLNRVSNQNSLDEPPEDISGILLPPEKVTIIDGMAAVHEMGKPPIIKTCAQWADHFRATLDNEANDYDEIHLVFDC